MRPRFLRAPLGAAAAAAAALLALSGCAADRDAGELWGPSEADRVVVQAVLLVDRPLPEVYLSRTVAPDRIPDDGDVESGAAVVIRTGDEAFPYFEHPDNSGRYLPFRLEPVRPATEYRLEIMTSLGEEVTAVTVTPDRFAVDSWVLLDDAGGTVRRELTTYAEAGDGVYDDPANQLQYVDGLLEARFAPPAGPSMQVGLFSLDPDSDFVIDPDFFDEEDFESLERANSSPPFSGDEGTLRLPWLAIFFEGRYQVRIYAVDRNWYDFVRSDPDLSSGGPGFGGNAGDAFERPIFRIEGGIGLFASAAVDSIGFRVVPAP